MREEYEALPLDEMDDSGIFTGEVVSSQECTGLIPALPQSRESQEAYGDLYGLHETQNSHLSDIMRMKPSRKDEKRS
jgi:hypothetical protein